MGSPKKSYTNAALCHSLPYLSTLMSISTIFAVLLSLCIIPFSHSSDTLADAAKNETEKYDYASYMKSLEEWPFDHLDLTEYQDFNSTKLMEQLVQAANHSSTPPSQFHQELRELIKLIPGPLLLKYNVSVNPAVIDPHTITHLRLVLMLPHYFHRFHEAPIRNSILNEQFCNLSDDAIRPLAMSHPEFGGLIAQTQGKKTLKTDVREKIIKVHAYALIFCGGSLLKYVDLVGPMLKERINKSLLSNEYRISSLKQMGVITEKDLINPRIDTLHENIPADLKKALDSVVLQTA